MRGDYTLYPGDCLESMDGMEENSVDVVVTDPPYMGSFMNRAWDTVASPQAAQEFHQAWTAAALRVLKPGGYLVAFSGARTYHRLACGIEDAGAEVRDMIQWNYACLSDDTELLMDGEWVPYNTASKGRLALAYNMDRDTFSWEPIQEVLLYDYDDTAYRLRGSHTDQLVSRNHRCIVERGGASVFALAEELAREFQARVPVLESVRGLLQALPVPNEGTGGPKTCLRPVQGHHHKPKDEGAPEGGHPSSGRGALLGMRDRGVTPEGSENGRARVLNALQREEQRPGLGHTRPQSTPGMEPGGRSLLQNQNEWPEQPSVERRGHLFPKTRELPTHQICALHNAVHGNGPVGRIRDGTSAHRSAAHREAIATYGSGPSLRPQPPEQRHLESGALPYKPGAQAVRAARFTTTDLVTIEPVHYVGKVWCIRVSTGAFVARRNGRIFITGNSGFPKGADASRALDRLEGATRPVVGRGKVKGPKFKTAAAQMDNGGFNTPSREEFLITGPGSELAEAFEGFHTALKPAHEPICVARKPFSEQNLAANLKRWGTGAMNIDISRLARAAGDLAGWAESGAPRGGLRGTDTFSNHERTAAEIAETLSKGRWPANVILSHADGCQRVGSAKIPADARDGGQGQRPGGFCNVGAETGSAEPCGPLYGGADGLETVEVWECEPGCPVLELNTQSGTLKSGAGPIVRRASDKSYSGGWSGQNESVAAYGDVGGASRFFFTAKPAQGERDSGCSDLYWRVDRSRPSGVHAIERAEWVALGQIEDQLRAAGRKAILRQRGNIHPTVKPWAVMEWLCRLFCPPGGIVLDPFGGSGSTAIPALRAGYHVRLCERDPDYLLILAARCAYGRQPLRGIQRRGARERTPGAQVSLELD